MKFVPRRVENIVGKGENIGYQYWLKAFVDDKMNVTHKIKFVSGRVEDIAGKGENADYQHFLHMIYHNVFKKVFYSRSLKVIIA